MKLAFVILSSLLLLGCNNINNQSRKNDERKLKKIADISIDWKKDSIGCDSLRKLIIESKEISFDSLIGFNVGTVYKYLGKPNAVRGYDSHTRIFYFIDCKYAPISVLEYKKGQKNLIDRNRESNETGKLVIEYNNDSTVTQSSFIFP